MIRQFHVQTCPDRTRATGDRVWRRLFEGAIDAGTRDLPHTRNARQTIIASKGGRERPAHRLDLLEAKGLLPSRAAILAYSSSLSMVIRFSTPGRSITKPTKPFADTCTARFSRSSCARRWKPASPPHA